jgi:hypothetical protein
MYIHHNKKNIHNFKKTLDYNWNLNFLHSPASYNKFYEWENHNWFDVDAIVMYYH